MRTILRVAGLVVQGLHDSEVNVVANQVSSVKRTGLHAGAELHSNINVSRGSDTVSNDTHSLVHHRDQNAVNNETRTLVNGNRSLAQRSHQIERGLEGLIRGLKCAGNLNQLHDLSRVEEVAADELVRTVRNACSHFGYGQGGGVGSEDGVLRADLVQILEQILLQIHALQNNFHDEVSVGSGVAVYRGLEGSKKLILVLLGHLALLYEKVVVMSDDGLAALGELRLNVDHGDVMASVQENFRNACAHIACAEYTYFHVIKPLSYSLIGSLIVISRKSMQKGSGEAPLMRMYTREITCS